MVGKFVCSAAEASDLWSLKKEIYRSGMAEGGPLVVPAQWNFYGEYGKWAKTARATNSCMTAS
jgi:hypothetical protein